MNPQFAEVLRIGGYKMAMCAEPFNNQFAQAFVGRGGGARGYQGTWEIREGRLYLIALVGTLKDGAQANLATLFPNSPDGVFAHWYSGPVIEPEGTKRKYIPHAFRYTFRSQTTWPACWPAPIDP
jgi:hypothetical protein